VGTRRTGRFSSANGIPVENPASPPLHLRASLGCERGQVIKTRKTPSRVLREGRLVSAAQ
jgi:hypothetical protein